MNGSEKIYDSAGTADRIKNLIKLALFTLAGLLVSIIVIDLIVFPLAVFAVNNTPLFNEIFKKGFLAVLIFAVSWKVIRRSRELLKSGMPWPGTVLYLIKRPFHYSALFFGFIIISAVITGIIYFILSYNYYMIYKITNG
jgi:hypothetical protein